MRVYSKTATKLALLFAISILAMPAAASPEDEAWCAARLRGPHEPAEARPFALTMSGGGYRAMLYHIGALRKLNDAGLLSQVALISSVSGGSITAGMLAHAWRDLEFEEQVMPRGRLVVARNFDTAVAAPLLEMANTSIDVESVIAGIFPGGSAADRIADRYDEVLFHGATLSQIEGSASKASHGPSIPIPHFIFNATSLQTGELWQFRPRAMGGPVVGWTESGGVRLAQAVAASSAFPPFLSPLYLTVSDGAGWHNCKLETHVHATDPDLHTGRSIRKGGEEPFRREVLLTDGGVRDNLGLVAVQQVNGRRNEFLRRELDVLSSDAGRSFGPEEDPHTNWFIQTYRVLNIATNEPDLLRIEALVTRAIYREDEPEIVKLCAKEAQDPKWPRWRKELCFKADASYWSSERIPPQHEGYDVQPSKLISPEHVKALGRLPTRLTRFPETVQRRLINWGYLSAHYGLPFINRLWQNEIWRLNICKMPYKDGLTGDAQQTARLCVTISER